MSVAKIYNSGTGQWEPAIIGKEGPTGDPGVVQSTTEPADTSVLWLDTDDTAEPLAIPAGGEAGQILQKSTGTDYDTAWSNPPSHNYIINGAFDVWQRGTSFSNPTFGAYFADRFNILFNGTGATRTISRQEVPVDSIQDLQATYYLRWAETAAGSGATFNVLQHKIEDARTLASQDVTLSFWAKADSPFSLGVNQFMFYGSGGSAAAGLGLGSVSVTTSWQRFKISFTSLGVAGKTVGAGSYSYYDFVLPINSTFTFDITGVQLEAGSVATPFKRHAPSLQGELAACQRYYEKLKNLQGLAGVYRFGTTVRANFSYLVEKRATPSIIASSVSAFGPSGSISSYGFSARPETALIELSMDTTQTIGYATSVYLENVEISAEL